MKTLLTGFSLLLTSLSTLAAEPAPVIKDFGYFYNVPSHVSDLSQAQFKIAFDVGDGAEKGAQNNHINSLARFINMHVAHGVKPENIQLALVIHGSASVDVLENSFYNARFDTDNKNQSLLNQLLANNTVVYVCGQSAMHMNVAPEQLIPGVKMALSAMTAHAQLQQQGYTLNPF